MAVIIRRLTKVSPEPRSEKSMLKPKEPRMRLRITEPATLRALMGALLSFIGVTLFLAKGHHRYFTPGNDQHHLCSRRGLDVRHQFVQVLIRNDGRLLWRS